MRCSICQKPISNPETLASGIGEICLRRMRFAERLSSDKLESLINKKERIPEACKKKRSLIIKNKKNENIFITILSSNDYAGKVINRTKLNSLLSKGSMYAIAYMKSIEKLVWADYLYVSEVNNPKDKDLLKIFKKFTKEHKEEVKREENIIKDKAYRGMLPYYRVINSINQLNSDQKHQREYLFEQDLKNDNNWNNYFYHYSTIQKRLHNSKTKEAKRLLSLIQKENIKNKDYGLTDTEIQETLKFNKNNPFDYFLINCFFSKNPNINYIFDIYDSLEGSKNIERIKKINTMKLLAQEKNILEKEEVERLL